MKPAMWAIAVVAALPRVAADVAPLQLVARIPVPAMSGTWDHLGADEAGLLFGNAQDIHTLEVVNLGTGRVERSVTGPFNRNQGIAYLADLNQIVVSNGRSGTCVVLDARTFAPGKSIGIGLGADLMAYDPAAKRLYVDHGGRDSNRGFGAVAVIDMAKQELVADIPTDVRPAAMAIAMHGPRLFVCLPGANEIAVIDRAAGAVVRRFPLRGAAKPVSIALDEPHRRLFVLTRTPPRLVVLDSDSGRTVASVEGIGEAEDIWFDAGRRQLYTTGLEGAIGVYRCGPDDQYELRAKIPTKPHAGTSVWIPALDRFCVGVAQHEAEPPAIWVYRPQS